MRRLLACLIAFAGAASATPGQVVRVAQTDLDALPSRGPNHALVTIEAFFAPTQRSRLPGLKAVERLQAAHPSRVRVVYRLRRAPGSSRLHYAALEAYAERRFDAFFAELERAPNANLTDAQLFAVAAAAGLRTEQLAEVIANPPAEFDRVLDDDERRDHQRLHGQPGILMNGRAITAAELAPAALEQSYRQALDTSLDLLDRGVALADLPAALDAFAAPDPMQLRIPPNSPDDTIGDVPGRPILASPPLPLAGLPSLGPADAAATIAVLCIPSTSTTSCSAALHAAKIAQDAYGDRVRVVWAPFFDVGRPDAGDLGLLGDAALCAEQVGTSAIDFGSLSSPGWDWLQISIDVIARARRRISAELVIALLISELHVDEQAFAGCRARTAGAAIHWAVAAVAAGVHSSPSTVVGGRIYPALTDANLLQQLVGAELEPGDCDGCLRLDTLTPAWRSQARP